MLSEKSEVSTSSDISRSRAKVPTMDSTPITQWYGGRDRAAEHEQQQQGQDREGDQLGVGQVLASLVVDLVEARRVAGVVDPEQVGGHPLAHRLVGQAALVLEVGGGELGGQGEGAAVGRQEGGARDRVVEGVDHVPDEARPGERCGQSVDLSHDLGILEVERPVLQRPEEHHDGGLGRVAEVLREQLTRLAALRCRVREAGGLEVVLDVVAEEHGQPGEHHRRHEHPPGVVPGEARSAVQHDGTLLHLRPPVGRIDAVTARLQAAGERHPVVAARAGNKRVTMDEQGPTAWSRSGCEQRPYGTTLLATRGRSSVDREQAADLGRASNSRLGNEMHELQIAEQVVNMLDECRQGRGVSRARLLLGRRWHVDPDTLQFCFELATAGTPLEGAELEIKKGSGRDLSVTCVEVA